METTAQKIDLKNLDKSGWETFRFEEIASKISETVDPNSTALETYVGLEHLDAEDIHIRRKGTPDDVSGGKLKCYPGDVIFGKRRAYQRKAAIVDFDGICSAHAFVFRANPEIIDPKLFPFFLHSDQFMHRMVDISVGGLSPTINWGDLKHQEFLLPPKDQQAQLAELLWAMDEVIESEMALNKLIVNTKRSFFKNYRVASKYKPLSYFCSVSYGLGQPPARDENGVSMIRATDICKGKIDTKNFLKISKAGLPKGRDIHLNKGDIIIVRSGAYTGDLAMVTEDCEGAVAGYDLVIRSDERIINPIWLQEYLLEREAQNYYKGESIRSAQPHLNSKQVLDTIIPFHSIEIQIQVSEKLSGFYKCLEISDKKIMASKALQKSLINQIF
jgi:restriction endonuclease S subunit